MGSVLFNIGLSRNFSGSVSLGKGKKSKSKQMELHQTKKFVHSQGNHQQNKILLTEWEKILANNISIRG